MNILLIVLVLLSSVSCVSSARYKRDLKIVAEVAQTSIEISKKLEQAKCAEQTAEKDAMLRKFNLLNEDGSLR